MTKIIIIGLVLIAVVFIIRKFTSKMKKYDKLKDLIISVLDVQSGKVKNKEGILDDKWILGYIFGMCSLPVREFQMNKSELFTFVRLILSHFYGKDNFEGQVRKIKEFLEKNDQEFVEAREVGCSELAEFMANSNPVNMPMGIAKRQL